MSRELPVQVTVVDNPHEHPVHLGGAHAGTAPVSVTLTDLDDVIATLTLAKLRGHRVAGVLNVYPEKA